MHLNSIPFELIKPDQWSQLVRSAATEGTILTADSELRISAFPANTKFDPSSVPLSVAKIHALSVQKLMRVRSDKQLIDSTKEAINTLKERKIKEIRTYGQYAASTAVYAAKTAGWVASYVPVLNLTWKYIPGAQTTVNYVNSIDQDKKAKKAELQSLNAFETDLDIAFDKTQQFYALTAKHAQDTMDHPCDDPVQGTLGVIKKETADRDGTHPDMLSIFRKDFNRDLCWDIIDTGYALHNKEHRGSQINQSHDRFLAQAALDVKFMDNAPPEGTKEYTKLVEKIYEQYRDDFIVAEFKALRSRLSTPANKKWLPIIQAACCQGMLIDIGQLKAKLMGDIYGNPNFTWHDSQGFKRGFACDHDSRFKVELHRNPKTAEVERVTIQANAIVDYFATAQKKDDVIKTKIESCSTIANLVFDLYFEGEELKVKVVNRQFTHSVQD